MKNKLHLITLLLLSFSCFLSQGQITDTAQDSIDDQLPKRIVTQLKNLDDLHEIYASEQKLHLKEYVTKINNQVKEGKITQEEATIQKEEKAARIAKIINTHQERIAAEKAFIQLDQSRTVEFTAGSSGVDISVSGDEIKRKKKKYRRTSSSGSIAFGHNFIQGEELGIDDFSYPRNNYFALGHRWKTTLDKDQNHFRLVYGLEYQSQGTELNGNRYFTQGATTSIGSLDAILPVGADVSKAKFRQDQLVFPVSLEIGGTNRTEYEDGRVRFNTADKLRVGLGGYAGFNLSSRLKLKYESDGRKAKDIRINNFDNEVFLYGLDGYVGYDIFNVFGRLSLNNVFNQGSVDGQYITFGIRLQD